MSGGGGVAQFRTCVCGGLLNDTWDACRFCGEVVGAAGEDDADENVGPDGSPTPLPRNDDADDGGARRSIPVLPVLAIGLVIALLGYFVFQRPSDDPEADLASAETQRAGVAADFEAWCAGDRAIGIAEAPMFELSETDRAVFVAPVPGETKAHDMSRLDDARGYASVIVCQDRIGEPVAGQPCDGGSVEGAQSRPIAFFHLVAYSARSAEMLGEMDVGPNAGCEAPSPSGALGDPAPVAASPDPTATSNFITLFRNPT